MIIAIESMWHLAKLAYKTSFECKMWLNGGMFSRKTITYHMYYDKEYPTWTIYNHIDDTINSYKNTEELNEKYPLILEAIKKRSLTYED